MSFAKAYKFRKRAKELGFCCDNTDRYLAETGTTYLTVYWIDDRDFENTTENYSKHWIIRFSNHGQVYDGADFSIDPDTGLTQAKVLKMMFEEIKNLNIVSTK